MRTTSTFCRTAIAFGTLFLALVCSFHASAQLTGIKTIPGDYLTISAAITDLNLQGVGPGGVTFNVAAGHTETGNTPVITATGTLANPIVFQKSGAGTNPVIIAGIGTSTTLDGIIRMSGTDYITFDAIDVMESAANTTTTTQAEWGYALLKATATNGCQNVIIRNSVITLNNTNTNAVGIYAANHTSASTASLTVTSAAGTNSFNQFYGNTMTNVFIGIRLAGYIAPSPYTLYDQDNWAGTATTGNTITNYGSGTTTAYGVYGIYQNNIRVANNTISSNAAHASTLYGIFLSTGTNSNVDIYGNTITLNSSATTSTLYGINNSMGNTGTSNTANIYNNTVQNLNWATVTSGAFYGIYNNASVVTVNMYGNTVTGNSKAGTGAMYPLYQTASVSTANIYNNNISNNTQTGTGLMYALYSAPATTTNNSIYGNTVSNNTSGGTFYGIYNTTGNVTDIYNNLVHTNTTTSAAGTIAGIYTTAGTTANIRRNKVYGISTSGTTGEAYGIYTTTGTTRNISNNLIGNITAPSTSNVNGVSGLYIGSGSTVNVYYNTIYLNAGSTGTDFGSSGIYASTTPTVEIRNNIVVNTSTPNGTGLTVAYRRSSATLTTFASASNNNLYYAGTPSANRLIYYDGTNADQTLAAYKTRVAPRESASITENPTFLSTTGSSPSFLHINGTVPTYIESGAAPIAGYTDDYDAVNVRTGYPLAAQVNGGGTAPDIGADEGDFTPVSLDMSVIALLSPLTTGCHTATETVRVRVRNNSNTATINFATNNVTINTSVTGPNPMTFPALTLSSGTLAPGATLDTTIATTYNMTLPGTYTFSSSTSVVGEQMSANDAMTPVTVIVSGGTASLVPSQICSGNSAVITLAGYNGTLQWQSYDAVNMIWVNETGPGNTSASYTVTPTDTMIYRALVCGVHISNADTLEVISLTTPTASNASRCGPGVINLSASGQQTLKWYDAAAGGNVVNTGPTYSPNLSSTDTFYVESEVIITAGSPLKITEIDLGANDQIEIQNLSGGTINTTGWKVAISDSYTNINQVNTILWNLPSTINAGQILTRTDLSTSPNYWGNNMFWNPGAFPSFTGWAMIIDNNGAIVDFIAWEWPSANIQGMNPIVNGNPTPIGTQWSGNGILTSSATAGMGLARQGTNDNNDLSDFSVLPLSIGTQNPGLSNITSGCTSPSRAQVIATINPVPVVALGNDAVYCADQALTLDAGNPGSTYSWSNGATSQTVLADTSGTYIATVTNTAMCTSSDTIVITVNPLPVVTLGADVVQCGGNVTLNPGPGFFQYIWSTTATSQAINVASSGNYSVTVFDGNGCSNSDTAMVTINPNPIVNIGADTAFCQNDTIVLNAGNTGMNYLWSTGSTAQSIMVGSTDTTIVTVTNPTTGCATTDSIIIIVDPLPVVNLGADIVSCSGAITLNAGNPGSSYLWSHTFVTQTAPVGTSGTYWVQVTSPAGCLGSDTINVSINTPPVVNLGSNVTQCGGSVTLNAGNAGSSFAWSHGPTTQTTVITSTGTYSVTVTSPQGCTGSDAVTITINPNPVADAGNDTIICLGTFAVLDAGAGYSSYSWTAPAFSATTQQITVSPAATTTYTLSVTDNNGCTSVSPDVVVVTIEQAPVAGFTSSISSGFNVILNNTTTTSTTLPYTSSWNFGDGSPVVNTTDATHTYTSNGTFTITLTVTNACGSDTYTQQVTITGAGIGIDEAAMLAEVKVYPNPSEGMFNIATGSNGFEKLMLTVTDITGRLIHVSEESNIPANYNIGLDLSTLAKGVYYLNLNTGSRTVTKRIVIQ